MLNQAEEWLLKEKYGGEKSSAFFADCERLAAGEPLGYIICHVPFLDCIIHLDSHPLIPRPETEFWVEQIIKQLKTSEKNSLRVLDLCAGSGCIGVAVAKAVPMVAVDFGEIDGHHLATINKNIFANQIEAERCNIIQSNLFENIPNRYDIILSNPPYIDPVLDRTETAVKNFEPHLALYGGQGGLELISTIIAALPAHLHPHGQAYLEHEPEQSLIIQQLGRQHGFLVSTHKDQYNIERYSRLVLQ